jgi:O-antigen/teichoic acid export membrane protein
MDLTAMPMNKALPLIIQVAYPVFCQMSSQREQFVRFFRQALRVVSFIAFPVFFGLAAVAPQFVPLLFGERWSPMVQALCF